MVRFGWSVLRDGEELALVTGWLVAAVLVGWLVAGEIACRIARRRPGSRAFAAVAQRAPAPVRRAHGILCTTSILLVAPPPAGAAAGGVAVSPSGAAEPVAVAAEIPFVRASDERVLEVPIVRAPATEPISAAAQPQDVDAPPRRHHVVAGDNLWRIAADEVARATGRRDVPDADVLTYWRAVVHANRATLRSGDPSLIHPGELVALPHLPPG